MHLEERDDDALPEVTDSISVLSSSSSSGFVVERSSLHKKRSKTSRVKKRTEKAGTVGVAIGNNQHTLLTEGKKVYFDVNRYCDCHSFLVPGALSSFCVRIVCTAACVRVCL